MDLQLSSLFQNPGFRGFDVNLPSNKADSTDKPETILNASLQAALQRLSTTETTPPAEEVESSEFTPDKVASRVLDFIKQTLEQRGGSEIEQQSLLEQAREGIMQGINEARDILSSAGQLSNKIDGDIKKTQALIMQGLDEIELNNAIENPEPISLQSTLLSASDKQSRSASIQIETRDGDIVEISFSAFQRSAVAQATVESNNQTGYAFISEQASSVEFSFSVQGNLDEGETQAVNALVDNISKVAGKFYNGNVQDAFQAATQLGFNSEELAAFSLDFQYSRTTSVVSAYQTTQQLDSPEKPATGINEAVEYLAEINELINSIPEATPFKQPEISTIELFKQFSDEISKLTDTANHAGKQLLNKVLESL